MSTRVYKNGHYLATDCPLCAQEIRADVYGDRVRFACRGGHEHSELEGVIDPQVMMELAARARSNRDGPKFGDEAESAGPKRAKPGSRLDLREHEPWAEPVAGRTVAGAVAAAIERHVVIPLEAIVAVTLWVLFAWVHDSSRISPLLVLSSPAKRCGKTTLLGLILRLVPRPLPSSNISLAALFRVVEAVRPTLGIDEADSFLGQREELRGIINSGPTRDATFVLRVVGDGANAEVRRFGTWTPKAIALIGKPAETIADRPLWWVLSAKPRLTWLRHWRWTTTATTTSPASSRAGPKTIQAPRAATRARLRA